MSPEQATALICDALLARLRWGPVPFDVLVGESADPAAAENIILRLEQAGMAHVVGCGADRTVHYFGLDSKIPALQPQY